MIAKETGDVIVSLHVSKEGQTLETKIEKSSGHQRLDSASVDGMRKCEFIPATANDVAIDSWVKLQNVWRIE